MNEAGKNIIQHLFGNQNLADINRRELETLTEKYPYFSVPQLLLAKKLYDYNSNGKDEQLQKTALYFSNPYWLNYLLHEEEITNNANNIFIEPVVESTEEEIIITEQKITDSTETKVDENLITGTVTEEQENFQEEEKDEIVPALEITAKELAVEPKDEIIPAVEIPEEGIVNETDEIVPAIEVTAKELVVEPTDEIVPAVEVENIEPDNTEEYTFEDEEIDMGAAGETDSQRLKLSSIIEQHLADFKKPVDENITLPIKPSPYHTIDYFASQGIKMDGQDNLSNRVRKFTDWLKQMKGKNPQPNDLGTDLETEKLIETIAASSNEEKDIVTEAMAEVLIKQGKTEKAIQLYKKLGLLNPHKSAYFAAKIDVLNNN